MMAVVVCSATGLSAPMLVASAEVSDTADWRRIAGRTPPLPDDDERADTTAVGGCCGCDAVVWEMMLDDRRDRAGPDPDIGDACDDMDDWRALSMRRSLAAEPLTDMESESPSDSDAIDDSPDVVVICPTAVPECTNTFGCQTFPLEVPPKPTPVLTLTQILTLTSNRYHRPVIA